MTKDSHPIQELPTPKEVVNPNIKSGMSFVEWEAGTSAGLDMYKWEYTATYPREFKERVIAWYKLHGLVDMHTQIKAQREARKKSKRKRR